MIDWKRISKNEVHGSLRLKPDTVFLAQREEPEFGNAWLLWGAFVPNAKEPAEYDTLSEVKAAAAEFTYLFFNQVLSAAIADITG